MGDCANQQRGSRQPTRNYYSTFDFFFNQVEHVRNRSPSNNLKIMECRKSMKYKTGSSLK